MFNIQNRRYTGNKHKLMPWIEKLIDDNCENCSSFFDVFAGTGSVTSYLINKYQTYILNDFLYSNNIIYNGFFLQDKYNNDILNEFYIKYNSLNKEKTVDNYVSDNFGDKFFELQDAKIIGYIREDIEKKYKKNTINYKEYCILISSLIYSMDRIANTVGHYEAYFKNKKIKGNFKFELIQPINLNKDRSIQIYREDSNELATKVSCDIAFIDPPYNSRQYSRFYHVLENIVQWKKPELFGTAMKPKEENMSDYCRSSAPKAFEDLINNLNSKYIVVTYNNTYTSKSSSSKNKITLEQINEILCKKGITKIFEQTYKAFNAGKTDLSGHKEYVFITKVNTFENKETFRSPFFYVGDKYKLMPQLKKIMPKNIDKYIEPFVGGGSSFLNSDAEEYYLNDINPYVINLHKELCKYSEFPDKLFKKLYHLIDKYELSCSYRNIKVPDELKKKYVKTYYAKYNKDAYIKMRNDFNKNKKNYLLLYLLLIYGFNHMIRFNSNGDFNLPVGNVDFNKNVYNSLINYLKFASEHKLHFYNLDYKEFLNMLDIKKKDYVFLDPPYLISMSEYNKLWNLDKERELCKFLDALNNKGVYFGITNLLNHKTKENDIFRDWSNNYKVNAINSNYISFNDNTIKATSKEVFVTNYEK